MKFYDIRKYNALLLSGGAVVSACLFVYAMLYGHLPANFWVFRCDASMYSEEYFLSYCSDKSFGSYEHGAVYFGTEPEIVASLTTARVVLLGNSRAQIAFSSQATEDYFAARNVGFFNMAFGGEMDVFPRRIIEKYDLRPDVIIVNVDYFFYDSANIVARKILNNTSSAHFEYDLKAWVQPWHWLICTNKETLLGGLICGGMPTQYKSRRNGRVRSPNWPNQNIAITYSGNYPASFVPGFLATARKFKRFADKRGACLVLTVVPSFYATPKVGREIAAALKVPIILPPAQGLTSVDGSHLNPESAEVWSRAFFNEFGPVMDRCLKGAV